MTYHSAVSGYGLRGLGSGLGDLDDNVILVHFKPGPGIGGEVARAVMEKIRSLANGLGVFYNYGDKAPKVYYVANNVFELRAQFWQTLSPVPGQGEWTLARIGAEMKKIAAAAVRGTDLRLYVMDIKNLTDGREIAYDEPPPPPSPVQPAPPVSPAAPPAAVAFNSVPVKDLQLRLIATGARIGADNRWGNATKTAVENFARSINVPLPAVNTRPEYTVTGNSVTLPNAIVFALPAPAPEPGRREPRPSGGDRQPAPGGEGGGTSQPDVPELPGADVSRSESKIPWAWIAAGVGVVAVIGVMMMDKGGGSVSERSA